MSWDHFSNIVITCFNEMPFGMEMVLRNKKWVFWGNFQSTVDCSYLSIAYLKICLFKNLLK